MERVVEIDLLHRLLPIVKLLRGLCVSYSSYRERSLFFFFFRFGYLYSFITTGIPIYCAKILGGDYIKNGIHVSVNWLICWLTAILAGLMAASLTTVDGTTTKTIVRKVYAGIVLILSPLMLLGVVLADCNKPLVRNFISLSVVLLAFERSSLRINALDLCAGKSGFERRPQACLVYKIFFFFFTYIFFFLRFFQDTREV